MKPLVVCLVAAALSSAPASAQIEIAYDDGSAENGIVWNEPGNGVAVRFTIGPDSTLVGARFYVEFAPFQNSLGICVLDANGPGGAPGDTLCGYFRRPLGIWAGWKDVTFQSPVIAPDGEAYIVYLQTGGGNGDSNQMGIDTSSHPDNRSWVYEGGVWSQMPPSQGDVMIRAIVTAQTPVLTSTWGALKADYR